MPWVTNSELFRPILAKANDVGLAITMDRPSGHYHAGETVHASMTVKAQKDLAVQGKQ